MILPWINLMGAGLMGSSWTCLLYMLTYLATCTMPCRMGIKAKTMLLDSVDNRTQSVERPAYVSWRRMMLLRFILIMHFQLK